jgi:3-oxoacid CoA-transferase A subunit
MKPFNKVTTLSRAMDLIRPGARIMVGGFGNAGNPEQLIQALVQSQVPDLTIISNDLGSPGVGLGKLLDHGQVTALIGNYYNWNPDVAGACLRKEISVTLVPQGTFAEAIRAAGVGIPAFYTPTGVGTDLARGQEVRTFGGRPCVLARAIHADIALIRARQADTQGNLVYDKTAQNFNPLMAMAAATAIAEVDEILEPGGLDPHGIVTPHLFVDKLVLKEAP